MKKSILLVLILAVICSVFNTVFATNVHLSQEPVSYDPKIQPGEMNIYTVGHAFEWGTPYEIVNSFLKQNSKLKWHDASSDSIYVSIQEANEHYHFYFQDNKLSEIFLIHTSKNYADIPAYTNEFIAANNISDLDTFAGNDELNLYAEKNPGAVLAADENTAYCVFFHKAEENSNSSHYAALILQDRSYADQNSNSNAEESKEEQTELNLFPNIDPAGFGKENFGYAFDWGTDYDTVKNFLSQTSGYDITANTDKISVRSSSDTYDPDSFSERYVFEFNDGKLDSISGSFYSMLMSRSNLPQIADELIYSYNLQELPAYTENERMNSAAGDANANFIISDDYTIYGIFNVIETGKRLNHVDFIFTDKNKAENGISSIDAGIGRPGKDYSKVDDSTAINVSNPLENLEPNFSPADFNNAVFGYAFDWGTDYDTVLNFLSQLSGYEMEKGISYISIRTTDIYTAPVFYKFEFSNGKLSAVSGSIGTMCMGNSALASLASITEDLKSIYGLKNREPYTKNGKMNAQAHNADTSFIVADNYTIYGLFYSVQSGNILSSVDFIFADKYKSETGVSSADAGIERPWEETFESLAVDSTEPAEASIDKTETVGSASAGDSEAVLIGDCKYGSYLTKGDKAEVVNVSALRMYRTPNNYQIEGLNAFPGKEISIISEPQCVNGVIWWEINFLGYIGWAAEMNADGVYYLEKR